MINLLASRSNGRKHNQLRNLEIYSNYNIHAEGSCLITLGNTKLICTASVDEYLPPFLRNGNSGWLTAEYNMLPRATHTRTKRESTTGKPAGRSIEIQRLIGRSLRAAIDLKTLGRRQIIIDCDVIQADGGTRTAAINGGYVALVLACETLIRQGQLRAMPKLNPICAISCGIVNGDARLDLDYLEDANADTDANFVMTADGKFIEVQATAENNNFDWQELQQMQQLAINAAKEITETQLKVINGS
ncbi:MAG: ribonuclease PH [Pseudomonadota bacterium]